MIEKQRLEKMLSQSSTRMSVTHAYKVGITLILYHLKSGSQNVHSIEYESVN